MSVEKEREGNAPLLINMDSQAPNEAAAEWLLGSGIFPDGSTLRREVTVGASRFDFSVTDRFGKITYVEVKGVTLERDGKVMFPDAPTERGVKHLSELAELSLSGVQTAVLFVIQMKGVSSFSPNDITHPAFGDALRYAEKCGTRIIAMDCLVSSDCMIIDAPVDVVL